LTTVSGPTLAASQAPRPPSNVRIPEANNATGTVRTLYVLPSDAKRRDRAALLGSVVEHNRQSWIRYGLTWTAEAVVTVPSTLDTDWFLTATPGRWQVSVCRAIEIWDQSAGAYRDICSDVAGHKYLLFVELDPAPNNSAAQRGYQFANSWVLSSRVMDAMIDAASPRGFGSISSYLGRSFGMPDGPCADEVQGFVCEEGLYYPFNRLRAADYLTLLEGDSRAYFRESPKDLFTVQQPGQPLPYLGADDCALKCLGDGQCQGYSFSPQAVCTTYPNYPPPSRSMEVGTLQLPRNAIVPSPWTVLTMITTDGTNLTAERCAGCVPLIPAAAAGYSSTLVLTPGLRSGQTPPSRQLVVLPGSGPGKIRLQSAVSGNFQLARCRDCVSGALYRDILSFTKVPISDSPAFAEFEIFPLSTSKFFFAFRADTGNYMGRCNGCLPKATVPDSVMLHIGDIGSVLVQWEVIWQ
jgi:hypothetical protein